jgi:hypothetical protein
MQMSSESFVIAQGVVTGCALIAINHFRPVEWNQQFATAPRIFRWFAVAALLAASIAPVMWLVASTEWDDVLPFHMWALGVLYASGWPFLVLALTHPVRRLSRPLVICLALTILGPIAGCSRTPESAAQRPPAIGGVVRCEVLDEDDGRYSNGEDKLLTSVNATSGNVAALNDLRDKIIAEFPDGTWVNFGPDSNYRTIRIVCRQGTITLSSWHPTFEDGSDSKVVASSSGITSLNGQDREEFLSKDDPTYVRRRRLFDAIQKQLREIGAPPGSSPKT